MAIFLRQFCIKIGQFYKSEKQLFPFENNWGVLSLFPRVATAVSDKKLFATENCCSLETAFQNISSLAKGCWSTKGFSKSHSNNESHDFHALSQAADKNCYIISGTPYMGPYLSSMYLYVSPNGFIHIRLAEKPLCFRILYI